jgi:hypothetical protein
VHLCTWLWWPWERRRSDYEPQVTISDPCAAPAAAAWLPAGAVAGAVAAEWLPVVAGAGGMSKRPREEACDLGHSVAPSATAAAAAAPAAAAAVAAAPASAAGSDCYESMKITELKQALKKRRTKDGTSLLDCWNCVTGRPGA